MAIYCDKDKVPCAYKQCRIKGSCARTVHSTGFPPSPDTSVAVKADENKNRVDLLPIGPMEAIAEILTFGANKYADNNWRKGFKWSRVYGALLRHMFAWWRGEKCDPETGKSHLAHAGCCIMFLLEHEQRKLGEDDRVIY